MKPLRNFVLMPAIAAMMLLLTNADTGKALTPRDLSHLPRVALVIGNGGYTSEPLKNPLNDARDMAAVLEKMGFDVTLRLNQGRKEMRQAIRTFGEKLYGNKVGLFFYAGHGTQVAGTNYLIPVSAEIRCPDEVQDEAVDVSSVLRKMESAGNALNLLILDACRNNPYESTCKRGGVERGLAGMTSARGGTMIIFSTRPGESANDGKGRNSPFTHHLLDQIQVPGLEVGRMVRRVIANVEQETREEQIPWLAGSPKDDFYFKPGKSPDEAMWEQVRNSDSPDVVAFFIKNNPNSSFVSDAREKMARLKADAKRERLRREQEARQKAKQEKYMADSGGTDVVTPEPDRDFTNTLGMKFVLIPPGKFRRNGAQVKITKGFHMQTTEVTQGQWKAVMGNNPSDFKNCGDDCPVENVSWNDAQEFIKKLNRKEGTDRYRLPTEAEWEYACRAGTETAYNWGDRADCSKANYGNGWSDECKGTNPGKTMKVASFDSNAWGLYDMHGNVWEWCEDWYGDYPSGSVSDPTGPSSAAYRVGRGGGWLNSAGNCRSDARGRREPSGQDDGIGFRLALSPGQ